MTMVDSSDSQAPRYQDLSLFRLPDGFRGRSAIVVQLWWFVQSTFFAWSPQFAYPFRAWLLRCFGAEVGRRTVIRPSVQITYPWHVKLGDHVWIGDDVVLYSLGNISVGHNSVISQRSYICAGDHDYSDVSFPIRARPIIIRQEVWIGTDVFVGPGVTIGNGAVIGARSSVFRSLDGENVYVGSPCQFVKARRRSADV